MSERAFLSTIVGLVVASWAAAGESAGKPAQAQPAAGVLKVRVLDETGSPLPARVHLRDATGRYLLAEGQSTRQRAVYKGTTPVCGDWFYTDGSFSIEVGPGEAQIDVAHGPAYATAHDAIPIVAGQSVEKTYTLKRLIDPLAMGWYSADEHLHQMPDAALMLAEDLNLAAVPICGGVDLSYRPGQRVAQLPDANHLLVTELLALEWDCFLWNLPKPLEMRLGAEPWPEEDFATSDRPGGSADLRTSFVVRTPLLVEQMHAAGATTIAYMHDPPRIWYYPLYVANGWIDVYGVLENGYCSIANQGSEADFWQSLEREGTISRIDIVYQGRVLKQIDVDPATDIRRTETITVPGSGWLAVRCLGRSENPNLSPAFAFAHTSPFYVLVDGRPIRSPEDARYFHEYFSAFVKRSLPRVKNSQIRRLLESKCRDALAKYAAQAE